MDFDDTPEEAEYRSAVRSFIEEHRDTLLSADVIATPETLERHRVHQATLAAGGYVGVALPKEWGGPGGTPMQQAIVNQEGTRANLPPKLVNYIGVGLVGPTIAVHGTDEQRAKYLPRMLPAEDVWCQLFSEPGAGSDLAGVRTSAVQEADGSWRVNGQKVWTTAAQLADHGLLLTRTDPSLPKHRGLTMFLVDMHHPGVTVRPLKQMSGRSLFNEVYLDDVIIPDADRCGDVNDGWRVALTTLMNERFMVGGDGRNMGVAPEELVSHARKRIAELSPDEQVLARQTLGEVLVDSLGQRYTGFRLLSKLSKGEKPGPEASAGKLVGTRAARRGTDLGVRLLGEHDGLFAESSDGDTLWQQEQSLMPGLAIAGGTNEVMHNIIGERILGLPPEPRVDKDIPFAGGAR